MIISELILDKQASQQSDLRYFLHIHNKKYTIDPGSDHRTLFLVKRESF